MKALALFSGGLDSMLAITTIAKQGIEVEAIHIDTGFGGSNFELLKRRANMAGASFRVVDISSAYLQDVLLNPKYGYGKAINPCIDCHGYMFKTALNMCEDLGASFVISGEVLGQRPMSQRAQALNSVAKLSEDKDNKILRPLSAKLLAPTLPEINGWVDREKLLDFSGRGRTRQMELANVYGYSDYESPAGGCLLTLQAYKNKIQDYLKYDTLDSQNAKLLRYGRHLRLPNNAKMIISRDEAEGIKILELLANEKIKMSEIKTGLIGAISLLDNNASLDDINLACSLALAYAKSPDDKECEFKGQKYFAKALSKNDAKKYFIV